VNAKTKHFEPLLFIPLAAYGGLVVSPGGVGAYGGTSKVGAGAYVNVTTIAACEEVKAH